MFKKGKFPKTNMSAQVSSVIFLSFFSLRSKLDIQCRFISFSIKKTFVINVQQASPALILSFFFSLPLPLFPPSVSLLLSLISKPIWTLYDNDISLTIYMCQSMKEARCIQTVSPIVLNVISCGKQEFYSVFFQL